MTIPTIKQYKYVQDNVVLNITRAGPNSGPTICFIPGWGGDHWIWEANFNRSAVNNDAIIIDFPGFGRSRFPQESLDVDIASQLIINALDDANIIDCILVGHSLGGALALNVASHLESRAKAVIAVDSLAFSIIYPQTPSEAIDGIIAPFKEDFKAAIVGLSVDYFSENTPLLQKQQIIDDMNQSNQAAGIRVLENYLAWDRTEALERYLGPVHALISKVHESLIDERVTERIKVTVTDNCGHYIMLDQSDVLQSYLDNIARN